MAPFLRVPSCHGDMGYVAGFLPSVGVEVVVVAIIIIDIIAVCVGVGVGSRGPT